jgi:hypothetical protein
MCGHKGGKCVVCSERVTAGNFESFDFDHKQQVLNHADKSDRWSGVMRDWPPFTDQWFAWAETVDLICSKCHRRRHKPESLQLTLDLEVQQRLDARINGATHSGIAVQLSLLDEVRHG